MSVTTHMDAVLVVGALWVHQREQVDHPVPEGWYVCHEDYTTPICTGSRRVGVASRPDLALCFGAANAAEYPAGVADVPEDRIGWPPKRRKKRTVACPKCGQAHYAKTQCIDPMGVQEPSDAPPLIGSSIVPTDGDR